MTKIGKRWLKRRLKSIKKEEKVDLTILKFEKEVTVDGKLGNHYSAIMLSEESIEDVEVFVSQEENQIIVFRKYVKPDDCDQFPDDLSLLHVGEEFPRFHTWIVWNDSDATVRYDDIVVAKSYRFRENGKIQSDQTALRNDKHGFSFETGKAKFMVTVGNQYLI